MVSISLPGEPSGGLLATTARLGGAETVETAVTCTLELVEAVFDQPYACVSEYDATGAVTTIGSTGPSSSGGDALSDRIPESVAERLEGRDAPPADGGPEATVRADHEGPPQVEVFVPVGRSRVLRVGAAEAAAFDRAAVATIEKIAANLAAALARIDRRRATTVDPGVASALFEQAAEPTVVSDTDGTLVAVNPAAVELTGRDREQLLGGGLADIYGPAAAEALGTQIDGAAAGTPESVTATLQRADGTERTVELRGRRVDIDGATHLRTTAHDRSASAAESEGGGGTEREAAADATALRQLNELTVGAEAFDETIERLLSLGCDHFDLDTGILSHVEGAEYEVEAVVDATGAHEAGAVYDLGETMCDATLASDVTETLAFADVTDTDHQDHPAAETVRAYIAAPVVVDGETYGTVNFSMGSPRSAAFRPEETELAKLIAQWVGSEIERRRRFEELERYETILEAVDDPVYALDAEGRFTFVNEAAKREFGYGEEILGKSPRSGCGTRTSSRSRNRSRSCSPRTGGRRRRSSFSRRPTAAGRPSRTGSRSSGTRGSGARPASSGISPSGRSGADSWNGSSGRSRRQPTASRCSTGTCTPTSTSRTSICTASTTRSSCWATPGGSCTTTPRSNGWSARRSPHWKRRATGAGWSPAAVRTGRRSPPNSH